MGMGCGYCRAAMGMGKVIVGLQWVGVRLLQGSNGYG